MAKLPVSIQLYTLRYLNLPLAAVLAQLAQLGYDGVELVHTQGEMAGHLREALDQNRLRVSSAHVPFVALRNELDATVTFHKTIGNNTLVLPYLDAADRPVDADGWRALGKQLDALGAELKARGMRLAYHNHDFELVRFETEAGEVRALDLMLSSANPKHLSLELDLGWVVAAGDDPFELLHAHAGRCTHVHAKDRAAAGQNVSEKGWADVGYGIIDWDVLLPAVADAGVEWLIVEHDLPALPMQSAQRSIEFLRSINR